MVEVPTAVSVPEKYAVCPVLPLKDAAPPPPTHVPFTAKQPLVRFMPCDPVEVAVRLNRVKSIPPENVVVAGEPKVKAPVEELMAAAATDEVAPYVEVAREKG